MVYQYVSSERAQSYRDQGVWGDDTYADFVDKWAVQRPDHVAVYDQYRRLTFRQLKDLSERVATGLCRLGLESGDNLGIQLPNWAEFAILMVAACRVGLVITQVGPDLREREIRFMLGYTGAKAAVLPATYKKHDYVAMYRNLQSDLPHLRNLVMVGDSAAAGVSTMAQLEATEPDHILLRARRPAADDLMRALFTSGTTGDPKAAVHTHNTTLAPLRLSRQRLRMGPDMVNLIYLPVGLNWGYLNLGDCFVTGGTAVLVDQFSAKTILQLIQQERVTHFCTAPTGLINLLNEPSFDQYDLNSLRIIVSGGASCPVEVIHEVRKHFPARFLEIYGMLETGYHTLTLPEQDPVAVAGSVGPLVDGMGLRILDDDQKDVAPGEVGEIAALGPSVIPCYLNNPEVNKRSFIEGGWFLTGDLGRTDKDGNLYIVDRKKEMIIRGGTNIYPREIEEVLYTHPRILKASVVGLPDPRLGERTCACLVTRDGQPISLAQVIELLEGKIAKYKWPERVEMFTELPLTPTGKVQKFTLRQQVLERSAQPD